MIFQLPTRLPGMRVQGQGIGQGGEGVVGADADMNQLFGAGAVGASGGGEGGEGKKDNEEEESGKNGIFDETMSKMGGRLGRIDIYENGEAELVITGEGGGEIRMDVTQGIQCGFKRTAAIVDLEEKKFTEFGDIDKTVVITPQIEKGWR